MAFLSQLEQFLSLSPKREIFLLPSEFFLRQSKNQDSIKYVGTF